MLFHRPFFGKFGWCNRGAAGGSAPWCVSPRINLTRTFGDALHASPASGSGRVYVCVQRRSAANRLPVNAPMANCISTPAHHLLCSIILPRKPRSCLRDYFAVHLAPGFSAAAPFALLAIRWGGGVAVPPPLRTRVKDFLQGRG
jgi:hypothetical protein